MTNSTLVHPQRPAATTNIISIVRSSEYLSLTLTLLTFFLLCSWFVGRYIPWGDEIQFVDPAANLLQVNRFVSTQWSNQADTTFWAGNIPGYTGLLFLVFQVFGFSQEALRYLNYGIMVLAVVSLWLAVRRLSILQQPGSRLLMVVLVLTGYSCYTCFSNIRYDGLGFLECALVLLAYTLESSRGQHLCFLLLGTAMAVTNLQLPQYVFTLLLILALAGSLGWQLLWRFRFLYVGFVVGGLSLLLLYSSHPGAWTAFLVTLQQQAGQSLGEKLAHLPEYLEYDASLGALSFCLLLSWLLLRSSASASSRKVLYSGLLVCTVIPALFFGLRRFVFSSAWMVYIPAAICVCRLLEREFRQRSRGQLAVAACCLAAIAFGLPKTLLGITTDWSVRNYAVVDRFVSSQVQPQDVLLCDAAAYFAAKPRVKRLYGPGYLDVINDREKQAINIVMVNPAQEAETLRILGGHWQSISELDRVSRTSSERLLPFATNFACRLHVFRRSA